MSLQYKTSYKAYPAWNYQSEIEDLNHASEQGWQLVKGGCYHSKFVKNPDIRYRYQLDYQKVDDMGRYIDTYREQGWEYVNSTFNGWHYFRKLYDPSLPEESYEIFTDKESLNEMKNRWARLAFILGILIAVAAVICLIRMVLKPHLPVLIQMLTFSFESAFLLRGSFLMRHPGSGHMRLGSGTIVTVFIAVVILGCACGVILTDLRPDITSQQQAEVVADPIVDNRWASFDVRYPDNYYLDLKADAAAPLTFEIVNAANESVYRETGTDINYQDKRIKLGKGQYWFSMTCDAAFSLTCSIE